MKYKGLAALLAVLLLFSAMACKSATESSQNVEWTASENAAAGDKAEKDAEEELPAEESDEALELIVFAAASMTETLQELENVYKQIRPKVELVFNFDSSGTLKTQIQEGADCDVFVSAGQKQVNQLDASKDAEGGNEEGLDFVLQGSRVDLLENKVVLCVPESNPKAIDSFDAWAEKMKNSDILFCMGNSDVPVGQYTQQIFEYYNLDEEELARAGKITYGTNVKEVTTQISEASVDAGIVYCTDAFSAELKTVDGATSEMCKRIVYPACVIKSSAHPEEAAAFIAFLQSDEAMQVFEKVGFVKP